MKCCYYCGENILSDEMRQHPGIHIHYENVNISDHSSSYVQTIQTSYNAKRPWRFCPYCGTPLNAKCVSYA